MTKSCDRCHSIKERCSWTQGSDRCARCARLGFSCRITRPAKKLGRRALSAASLHPSLELTSRISVTPSITETDIIYTVLSAYDVYSKFLVGPTFWDQHHAVLCSYYEQSKPILTHAYVAYGLSVAQTRNCRAILSRDELFTPYRYASLALQNLRCMHVINTQQAATCLILGTIIMLFAMFKRPHNVYTLSRQTLILFRPVYDTISSPCPNQFFFLTGTIMLEMLGSLIYGAVPALQFRQPDEPLYVDRYLGLTTSLLPLLFQICELNWAVSSTGHGGRDIHRITHSLDNLEAAALAWQASVPESLCQTFSAIEIEHISCQIQVIRMAALLMIHRIRFSFGVHDLPARAIGMSILTQLESTMLATGKPVKFVMVPVLVACVELTEDVERDRWMLHVPTLVCCSEGYGLYIQRLVRAYWAARDSGVHLKGYNMRRYLHDEWLQNDEV